MAHFLVFEGTDQFVSKVETLAIWELGRSEEDNTEQLSTHCLVALRLNTICIVIDIVFSPVVIVVVPDRPFVTNPYITVSGKKDCRLYRYTTCPDSNTRLEIRKGTSDIWHTFRPITSEVALKKMTVYNASRREKGTQIPARKQLVIRSIVRQAPIFSPATYLGNYTWMMDTCRLRVDFLNRRLILQLPLQDWLLLPTK